MARSRQTVNTVVRGSFAVYTTGAVPTPVLGLSDSDFTKLLAFNLVDVPTVSGIAIVEVGSGRYGYTFTPNAVGYWHVMLRSALYNLRGWQDEYDVVAA